jgi:hypothetical protein
MLCRKEKWKRAKKTSQQEKRAVADSQVVDAKAI